MKRITISCILICFISTAFAQTTMSQIDDAMWAVDLNKSEILCKELFYDKNAPVDDRISSAITLLYLKCRFRNNFNSAIEIANEAVKLKKDENKIYIQLAEMFREKGSYDSAFIYSKKAISLSKNKTDSIESYLSYFEDILKSSLKRINKRKELDKGLIEQACLLIKSIDFEPENVHFSYVKLGLCLIAGQGNEVINSWKQFFLANDTVQRYVNDAYNELCCIATNWNREQLKQDDVYRLVLALAHSRMYEYAEMIYKQHLPHKLYTENEEIKEVLEYCKFLENSKLICYNYYKKTILDKSKEKKYRKTFMINLKKRKKQLWKQIANTSYSSIKFRKEIRKRYGAVMKGSEIIGGKINGFYCYLGGHIIDEQNRKVTQYGRSAKYNFYLIDMLHSNDLVGYFLNSFIVGGWEGKVGVVQVRSSFLNYAPEVYKNLTDTTRSNKWKQDIEQGLLQDDSLARINPICNVSGTLDKINYDECKRILDSIKRTGVSEIQLKMKFISTLNKIKLQSAIFAHEGRHRLDTRYLRIAFLYLLSKNGYKVEYTAKLSEIAFSEYPFLILSEILYYNPNFEDAHGIAETKITINLYNWMEKHKHEIKNFNPDKPTLTQIQLLSNKQLLRAIRSMDPWGKRIKS